MYEMMNHIAYFWWGVALVLFILELITPTTILIFPSIAALVTGVFAMKFDSLFAQVIIFFGLTTLLFAMIRPFIKKNTSPNNYQSGRDALIGKEVRVIETIDNTKDQGKVKISADIFPARSVDNVIIPEGSLVIVKEIQGIKLLVQERK
ncbi:MAG: NfeD family protein [Brevinema sp.]